MPASKQILKILDDVLNLDGAALRFSRDTPLAGALPQFDSMAVVSLIARLEETFGIEFPEAYLDGTVFKTVGTLNKALEQLLATKGAG